MTESKWQLFELGTRSFVLTDDLEIYNRIEHVATVDLAGRILAVHGITDQTRSPSGKRCRSYAGSWRRCSPSMASMWLIGALQAVGRYRDDRWNGGCSCCLDPRL